MQADWLEKFYADDTYLDFGKAMRGEYNTPQINTLIQMANAQQMPCIIPSARQGRTVFYGLAQNGRSLEELRRVLTAALGSADTSADITWSGVNRNEEYVELSCDPHMIGEAITAFESQYHFSGSQEAF